MDGNPYIFNSADQNLFGNEFANIEPKMLMDKPDLKNLICASDTYFDPEVRKCTRYPYSEKGISIVYFVNNNVQHGHNMILQTIAYSSMFLPGNYQPKSRLQWSIAPGDQEDTDEQIQAVKQKYLDGNNEKSYYNFDPIFMGDFNEYNFQLSINDEEKHNFFAHVEQKIIPRKCVLVIDSQTKMPNNNIKSKILKATSSESEPDLEFSFYVETINGCDDQKTTKLEKEVVITTQP